MAVESAADRAAFVNAEEFGVTATYTPGVGSAVTLSGVFDEPTEQRFDGPGLDVSMPTLLVRTADLPGSIAPGERTGDIVTIGARNFEPRTAEPDGTGMTLLRLEEVD